MSCNSKCQKFHWLLEKILIIQLLLLLLHFKIICAILFLIVENIYKIYCLTSFFHVTQKKSYSFLLVVFMPIVKEPACNAGGLGSIPGLGRTPGEGHGYPLQYSCLENFID